MARNKYREQLTDPISEDDLLAEMDLAKHSGSHDLVSAQIEAERQNIPNAVDKEKYYGDFYDNIQPDVKHLEGTLSRTMSFNGVTFDRQRNNQEFILLDKLSYAFPPTQIESINITNYNARGCIILLDANDKNAFDQLTLRVEGKELASGNFYNILITPLLTTNFLYVIKIYPGLNPVAGFVSNDILPRVWRITVQHTTVTPILYGVTASMIL
jgi:hypothetical protein